ncbi:unnamed protein product [Fusarium equiseti]|uniref:Uncharacterized protein n=1 Tax=Fusarium equiseti TaxID=61235 RepID=A0A8J2J314_FUSEQ|nr:unnamed protein product [Fusarium equiseti]
MADLPELQRDRALNVFNKTMPIYIMQGDSQKRGWSWLLSAVPHNYLYRKWFRPYRTDIEWGQFIAKLVDCRDQPNSSDDATAVDVAMAIRSTIQTGLLSLPAEQFYTKPALFKALVVIISAQSYYICSSIANVSAMTVLVLLTGVNDGLSSSITFDSIDDQVERAKFRGMSGIRAKLEVAVDFIMSLEKREVAAFGPQPDPVLSTAKDSSDVYARPERAMYENEERVAIRLSWRHGQITGPSSRWVSAARYPKRTGRLRGRYAINSGRNLLAGSYKRLYLL